MMAAFTDSRFIAFVFDYVFYYPFLMAYVWMAGGLAHALFFERRRHTPPDPLALLPAQPLVTMVVPCYNEEQCVREVIEQTMRTRYPNTEVIAINDGSTDKTGEILDRMAREYPRLRVLHNASNQGKSVSLNTAVMLANGEYILGIDGDALVHPDAIAWMLRHLLRSPTLGTVTGNPRIRTRTTLLGRMQVGEFSSTIGLIKRTQQLWGSLFTVSGVLALFRRKALLETGFWSTDVLTEDIDVSWKLQLAGWRLRFEPRALCWILMPETVRGLFRQRQRWAVGGIQTLIRHSADVLNPRNIRMWPVYLEYLASVFWAYAMFFVLILAIVRRLAPEGWHAVGFLPEWHGVLLGITCILQMLVSLYIDRRYDRDILRYFVWTIWYPAVFWTINMLTTILAIPIVILRRRGERAVWNSPDRGVSHGPNAPRHRPHNEATPVFDTDAASNAATQAAAYGAPPPRQPDWAEPEAEPILDAARVPLSAYPQSPDGYLMYVWLHFARPLLVVLFWIGVSFYAWRQFFSPTEGMDDYTLLGLYALIVLGIFIAMLLIAPMRRIAQKSDDAVETPDPSTATEIAEFAQVAAPSMRQWRRSRRLAVDHDDHGNLDGATDLDSATRSEAANR